MYLLRVVSRSVSALAGLALFASTAAASPLSAAVEHTSSQHARYRTQPYTYAIVKTGRLMTDRAAALESVQIALSRVEDGSTYIWHRPSGAFSGSIKLTSSFRRVNGELCRHLVMEISSEADFRTVEGIACREMNGVWRLEG